MAAGDTQITIADNLVDDPELRFTPYRASPTARPLRREGRCGRRGARGPCSLPGDLRDASPRRDEVEDLPTEFWRVSWACGRSSELLGSVIIQ